MQTHGWDQVNFTSSSPPPQFPTSAPFESRFLENAVLISSITGGGDIYRPIFRFLLLVTHPVYMVTSRPMHVYFGIELDSLDDDIAIPAVTEKRKPGRQKKAAGAKTRTKRKPGRPKKTEKAAVTATPEKRKPGRPKKTEAAVPKKIASATGKKSTAKITRKVSKKNTVRKKS